MRIYIEQKYVADNIRNLFVSKLKLNIIQSQTTSLGLIQLIDKYSLDEILDATDKVRYDGLTLYVTSETKEDKILRYLEYGGEGVKPSGLITKTVKDLEGVPWES